MKRYAILILALLLTTDVWSAVPEKLTVGNTKIRKVNEMVEVSFEVHIDKLNRNYKVEMTPELHNGANRQALEPIVLTGKRRNLYDIRNGTNGGKRCIIRRETPNTIRYFRTVPYRDWMNSVSLSLQQVVTGCCTDSRKPEQMLAADKLLYYEIVPAFNTTPLEYRLTELEKHSLENPFLHPVEDYPNRYDILFNERNKGTAVIRFTVGSDAIDMNIPGNRELLRAMEKAFKLTIDDPNASLKRMMIAGYASPEGSLAFNTALAQRRAESFKNYLQ